MSQAEVLLEVVRQRAAELELEQDRQELPASLALFIERGWHTLKPDDVYLQNWHVEAVCEYLEAVSNNEITRLQVWLPPGTMKSLTVSVFWPAWEWTRQPSLKYWTASYETAFAASLSADSLRVIQSEWYQERWAHMFNLITEGVKYYSNDRGGSRLATAPESTGSGRHGHRIIIDDPINASDAYATSGVTLAQVNNWWDGTVSSRGLDGESPGGMYLPKHARVLVMQRLHENDLAGHAFSNVEEDWEVLCLPERYEASHPFVWPRDPRSEGELLWPEKRDDQSSRVMAEGMTSFRAAGQLQQRPAAREGEILKREWWRYYKPGLLDDPKRCPKFALLCTSVDAPLKDKQHSDFLAVQTYGVVGADKYLLDLRTIKTNYTGAKRTITEMTQWVRRKFPGRGHYILIETGGYGPELIQELKRDLGSIIKISPGLEGDKMMRAEAASADLEGGNVFLPGYGLEDGSGPDEHRCPADIVGFINNAALFPNGKNDDDVDSWSQAMLWLRGRNTAPMTMSSGLLKRRKR